MLPVALQREKVLQRYTELINERSVYETYWRQVTDYLVPGRGIYSNLSKPAKRQLTSKKVVNTTAEEALYVLCAGMHSALTSPSRPWFRLEWALPELNEVEFLKAYLQEAQQLLERALQISNFYSIINSFYVEYTAFGNGVVFSGDNRSKNGIPLFFELLTAGEYVFTMGTDGRCNSFMRVLYLTPRQIVEKFGRNAPPEFRAKVAASEAGIDDIYFSIIEAVLPVPTRTKVGVRPWTRVFHLVGATTSSLPSAFSNLKIPNRPLQVDGFYEMPYHVARWQTIGSDIYGLGPGERALPDIKRLQEMERTFLLAAHKSADPPLNAPYRMKGKINKLPGGMNYYSNPQELVMPLYEARFDLQALSAAIERTEERLKKCFYNDIFLIPGRGPEKSPLKAAEVNIREREKMMRLGPVVERLQHEFFQPMISRCFQILRRHGYFSELPPEYEELLNQHQFKVVLISPMATAQRSAAIEGINNFLVFVANAAQFDQQILDNIDIDAAAREVADINGVEVGILRPEEQVQQIRQQRAQALAEEKAKQEQMNQMALQAQLQGQTAEQRKMSAEAAEKTTKAAATAAEAGMLM